MSETANDTTRWEALEQWSPRLFILGGVLLLIGGANDTLIYFVGMSSPEAASVAFLMSGLLVAMIGLAGLYRRLVAQAKLFARVGLGSVVLSLVGVGLLAILAVASLGLSSFNLFESNLIAVIALPTGLLIVLAFFLFGVGILRASVFPRAVGSLLLVEFVLIFLATVGAGAVEALVGRGVFLVGAKILHFLVLSSIGYLLLADSTLTERSTPANETTVR